jgi:hypothetical protein
VIGTFCRSFGSEPPNLGLWCMDKCMGLNLRLDATPGVDVTDNGLSALMDMDALDGDLLLPLPGCLSRVSNRLTERGSVPQ